MIIVLLLLAAAVNSDTSIKTVIDQINTALAHHDQKALAAQFTPDADLWVEGRKIESSRDGVLSTFQEHQPWSESSHPRLKNVNASPRSGVRWTGLVSQTGAGAGWQWPGVPTMDRMRYW